MAAKSLGELYVRLSARTAGFAEALGKAADEGAQRVAEAADEIEGKAAKMAAALGDISDGFLAVGGVAAAAFAGAAGYSEPVTNALEKLKGTTATLAVEVGEALLPVLRDTTDFVKSMVSAWRSLDDGTKANVVSVVRWAAVLGPALFGLTRGIIIAKGFFEAFVVAGPILGAAAKSLLTFSTTAAVAEGALAGVAATSATASTGVLASAGAMAAGFAAALWPIAAVAAAIGALVLLAGALYKAWNDSGNGFADTMKGLARQALDTAKNIGLFFADMWQSLANYVIKAAGLMMEGFAAQVRGLAMVARPLASIIRNDTLNAALDTMSSVTGASLTKDLVAGAKAAGQAYVDAIVKPVWDLQLLGIQRAKEGVGYAVDGAKQLLSDVWAQVKDLLPDFSGKGAGALEDPKKADERFAAFEKGLAALQSYADQQTSREAGASAANDDRNAAASFAAMAAEDAFAKELADFQAQEMAAAAEEARGAMIADMESASDAFGRMADESRALAEEAAKKIEEAKGAFASKVMGRTGTLSGVAESFGQGMAVGGPAGGVAFAAVDLLSQSKGFEDAVATANGVLQTVANSLGKLIEPMQPLIGAIGVVLTTVFQALEPVLTTLGQALGNLAPVFMILGMLAEGLKPVFELVGVALKPLAMAGEALFAVIKWVAIGLIDIITALADVWNGLMESAKKALSAQAGLIGEFLGDDAEDFANSIFGSVTDAFGISTGGLKEMRDKLEATSFDSMLDAAGAAADRFGKSVDKAAESLTNVPDLFKVALRRGQSQNAGSDVFTPVGGSGSTGGQPRPTYGEIDMATSLAVDAPSNGTPPRKDNGDGTWTLGGGAMTNGAVIGGSNDTYNIIAMDPDEAFEAAERFRNRKGATDSMREGEVADNPARGKFALA